MVGLTDKTLIEYDSIMQGTLSEIERRISPKNFEKIEDLIKALMRVSADFGEYQLYQRIESAESQRKGQGNKFAKTNN